jgi:hypothetical protein
MADPKPLGLNFTPINNNCVDCNKEMRIDDRQEIAWDAEDKCRRRCAECINKRVNQKG